MAKSGMDNSDVDNEENKDDDNNLLPINITTTETTDSSNNIVSNQRIRISTPISILITSLVKDLCSAYSSDSTKVATTYKLICDKLFEMNMIDESYNMVEFEGVRSAYQKAFHQLLKDSLTNETITVRRVLPINDTINSHYRQEFDEIEFIAGGGFGQVYRVKHKLDGTEYAIKKIPIRADGIEVVRNYLSEVKTFASLNHSNVVQYKAAWLELGSPPAIDNNLDDSFDDHEQQEHHVDYEYIYHQDDNLQFSNDCIDDTTTDFQVDFEHSVSSVTNHSMKQSNRRRREKRSSISEGGKAICKLDMKEIEQLKLQQRDQIKWATLYIQMALCQSTLKQWLERRNDSELMVTNENEALVSIQSHVRYETIYEVLRQLLRGLEYIHSKGIVHHDIKPSNIFVQLDNGNLLVQLGDFGLACPLQSVHHSLALGTKLYAAPEQLAGKCDPKSDMYSLGIVLFELVEQFRTDMERVHLINDLRKEYKLPSYIQRYYPQLAQIIRELLSKRPEERPNATELLKLVEQNSDAYVRELERKLAERDEEIVKLKELLKAAGIDSI